MINKGITVAEDSAHNRHYVFIIGLQAALPLALFAYVLLQKTGFSAGTLLGATLGSGMSYALCLLVGVLAYIRTSKMEAKVADGFDLARAGLFYAGRLMAYVSVLPIGASIYAAWITLGNADLVEIAAKHDVVLNGYYALGAAFGAAMAHAINAAVFVSIGLAVTWLARKRKSSFGIAHKGAA